MAEGTFTLKVFSARGLELEDTVQSVSIPTEMGEIGVLANHCDYVGLIKTGIASYESATGGAKGRCLVSGGVVTFANNSLTLLADTVDKADEFDSSLLSQDINVLKAELEGLSLFDPAWEILDNKVARIEALKVLSGSAA